MGRRNDLTCEGYLQIVRQGHHTEIAIFQEVNKQIVRDMTKIKHSLAALVTVGMLVNKGDAENPYYEEVIHG